MKHFGFVMLVLFFFSFQLSFAQTAIGNAKVENKHFIVLDATQDLHQTYYAKIDLANFEQSAAKALSFFDTRIKDNHVRFEIIAEKAILVIHLGSYAKSPKTVNDWNVYFAKKSSLIKN